MDKADLDFKYLKGSNVEEGLGLFRFVSEGRIRINGRSIVKRSI